MSSHIRREKNNFLGLLATFRWPLSLSCGAGIAALFWTPLPEHEQFGFLAIYLWPRIFGVVCGAIGTIILASILKEFGTEIIELKSATDVIREALNQFRNAPAVTVRCLHCKEKLHADRTFSPAENREKIQLTCRCGSCNSTHPLH